MTTGRASHRGCLWWTYPCAGCSPPRRDRDRGLVAGRQGAALPRGPAILGLPCHGWAAALYPAFGWEAKGAAAEPGLSGLDGCLSCGRTARAGSGRWPGSLGRQGVADLRFETALCKAMPAKSGTVQLDVNWSPRGNQIAFVQASDLGPVAGFSTPKILTSWVKSRTLWVTNAGGTSAREITAAGTGIYDPQWSADGRHVLFVRDDALWLIDLRGGPPVRVLGPFPLCPYINFDTYGHVVWSIDWTWNRDVEPDPFWSVPGGEMKVNFANSPNAAMIWTAYMRCRVDKRRGG